MFNTLSKNLTNILEKLTKKGIVTEADVNNTLREVRISLLEADVALEVVKDLIEKRNLNVDIEIDGGINFENCSLAKKAGANILVSGSTIFKENKGDLKKNIEILRKN